MRILFFGTPDIAAPFLENLLKTSEVVGVITQPDKPSDRGQKLHAPPVKTLALAHNIPVFQQIVGKNLNQKPQILNFNQTSNK